MQASICTRRVTPFGVAAAPSRPAVASRGALVVTNVYGDLPKIGGGRKWEYLRTNENGKVVRPKLHVKAGDLVQVRAGWQYIEPRVRTAWKPIPDPSEVIAGADKGKTGLITKVVPKLGLVIVEGVNIKTKHIAPRGENEKGQIKKQEYPFHHSNVQHFSKEKQVRSRVGHKEVDGKKVRYLVKTGEILD